MIYLHIITLVLPYLFVHSAKIQTIANTKYGDVKGEIWIDDKGKNFVAFQGIPYAKPPIGDLRFRVPQEPEIWTGIKEAFDPIKKCPQTVYGDRFGEEDCLYLNLFTPEVNNDTDKLKPVMFYVHGGSFNEGSSHTDRYSPEFLIPENVVLVVANYRLGALGYLSLDENIAGFSTNNGMKDQVFALKWVQENIRNFGGDPNQVTIFGDSAGGSSVHYLVLSPLAKGLFHRAIAQSGTALTAWALSMNNSAKIFANATGIPTDNLEEMVKGLRNLELNTILDAQLTLNFGPTTAAQWMGSVCIEKGEQSFLPFHPLQIIYSGNYNKVPFMIGYTNQEGIMLDLVLRKSNITFLYIPRLYIPYYLDSSHRDEIIEKQEKYYWDGGKPKTAKESIDIYTDVAFKHPAVQSAIEHAKQQDNVFLYEFSMDTELNYYKKLDEVTGTYPGACHCDDLGYIFKTTYTPEIKPGSAEKISLNRMIRLWTNFAKFGNPTPNVDELLEEQIWKPVKENELNHMSLGEKIEAKLYKNDGYDFWASIYKDYSVKIDFPNGVDKLQISKYLIAICLYVLIFK